jgi:hypothetical protein
MSESTDQPKYNPYDFANPVSDKNIFIGRKKQLEDIIYYLNQAASAPRAINLALLGNRASGKTSLLNMIALEAKELGFCVVRIDLNEGDVANQLAFFYKLFDSILSEVVEFSCKDGSCCFGGNNGKTYDAYLDMTCAYEITEEKIWTPFSFPVQYAKAMNKGHINTNISDSSIKRDLCIISKEANAPIALLYDECNVLSHNRIILEKIRNIFMNLPGFMQVFTGTPSLFPLMDEIFSPIVRQFKRIDVDPFVSSNEIRECVEKPLESIGLNPRDVIDLSSWRDLRDIQSLTGGRPYEVQLLCHFMYKNYERGISDKMTLNIDVFDDVVQELSRGQDLYSRGVIKSIQEIEDKPLKALKLLASCCGKSSFEDIWAIEYLLVGGKSFSKNELHNCLDIFIDKKILEIVDDVICFKGDDFDRIYSKYYFKKKFNITLNINDYPQDIYLKLRLDGLLRQYKLNSFEVIVKDSESLTYIKKIKTKTFNIHIDTEATAKDIKCIIAKFNDADTNLFVKNHSSALNIYWVILEYIAKKIDKIFLIEIVVLSKNYSINSLYHISDLDRLNNLLEVENRMKDRGDSVGINFRFEIEEINLPTMDAMFAITNAISDDNLKKLLLKSYYLNMTKEYSTDKVLSKFYADCIYEIFKNIEPELCNNVGYVFMATGDYDKALAMFDVATTDSSDNDSIPLAYFNLGCLGIFTNSPIESVKHFTKCIDLIEANNNSSLCSCIFKPVIVDNCLNMVELSDNPDFFIESKNAIETINQSFTGELNAKLRISS